MAEGTSQRGGRLSGLIPLVIVGVIVFLFFRSCFQGVPSSIPFLGSDDDSEEDSDPPPIVPNQPDDPDEPSDAESTRMTQARDPECPDESSERHLMWTEAPPMCIDPDGDYTATLHTDRGDVVIDLDTQNAPTTVNNFVFLARWGFYDSLDFHVVIPGVSIQAGDPTGEPPEGRPPGYSFEGELPDEPDYRRYSVAMGVSGRPGIHSSVFFIVTGTEAQRPAHFSLLGRITDRASQAVVDEIDATGHRAAGQAGSGHDGTPREPTLIQSITITEK